ncbi:hypothetical protein [Deinococcus sp.]|uniref:hypothetical protein n=1 Tax=Deinococcus sp. TaxID=47478 RepID=UPI002869E472|nr:hypothetical protein [Deinococcus sp.]
MIRPEPRPALGSATTDARYYVACLYAIWSREVGRSVRESGQLVGLLSRPLLWVIILGVGLTPNFLTGLRETTFGGPAAHVAAEVLQGLRGVQQRPDPAAVLPGQW